MTEKRPPWHDWVGEAPAALPAILPPPPAPPPNPVELRPPSRHNYHLRTPLNGYFLRVSLEHFHTALRNKGFSPEQVKWIKDALKDASRLEVEGTATEQAEKTTGLIVDAEKTTLPEKAEKLYKDRIDKSEDGPAFFNRVYKDHIGNGLTRAILDKLDHPLVARIDALKRKKDATALALDLPTAYVAPQEWAKRVLAGEEAPPSETDAKTHRRNAQRLTSAREKGRTR